METKPKSYRMLKTAPGSRDGLSVETFNKGETYELNEHLAEQFYHLGVVEEVTGKLKPRKLADGGMLEAGDLPAGSKVTGNPAEARSTKVTGPTATKVIQPAEIKTNGLSGEAGVPLQTQRIEELVSVARDIYGLEVDSTMSEEHVEGLIEAAKGKDEDDAESAKSTKHGNKKPHGKK